MRGNKVLSNGRNKYPKGGLSQISTEMQESFAFQSLTASAIRVLLYAIFFNFCAVSKTKATGNPVFKFTCTTAEKKLEMNRQTFSRAKNELDAKGFLIWVKRGGLKGCNGEASEFSLSGNWKKWIPPEK